MSRILLDQNMPIGLRTLLPSHQVTTSFEMGWGMLENGRLLAAAQAAGFDIMLTSDQNIRHQQNLKCVTLALVVLSANHWPTICSQADAVRNAADKAKPGSYAAVELERPPLRRRPSVAHKVPHTPDLKSAEFSATFWWLVTCAHSRRAKVR